MTASTLLGLCWGDAPDQVKLRLDGHAPLHETPRQAVFALDGIVRRLTDMDAFCPSAVATEPDRPGSDLILDFADGALVAGTVRFGYSFEAIGQVSDTLGEQAMAAFARAELHQLILEMSGRHGAPLSFNLSYMRIAKRYPVGAALFNDGTGGLVQVLFGHDGGALFGELRYRGPIADRRGF